MNDMQDTRLDLTPISPADIEAFHSERETIVTAAIERLRHDADLHDVTDDETRARIAVESVRIFTENLYVCIKYGLPGALTDYVAWLRGFLASRNFPGWFLPRMLASMQAASIAFLDPGPADAITGVLRSLRRQELALAKETHP